MERNFLTFKRFDLSATQMEQAGR